MRMPFAGSAVGLIRIGRRSSGLGGFGCSPGADAWCVLDEPGDAHCFETSVDTGYEAYLPLRDANLEVERIEGDLEGFTPFGSGMLAWDKTTRAMRPVYGYTRWSPVAELAPGTFTQVEAPCALTPEGQVQCWGRDSFRAETSLSNAEVIATSGDAVCAIDPDGAVACVGQNYAGQAGSRPRPNHSVRHSVIDGLPPARAIEGGDVHFCAITRANDVWCWGHNGFGQLGDGTFVNSGRPLRVAGLPPIREISLGIEHTCALADDGRVYCWGKNTGGQLGSPHLRVSAVPVRVDLPDEEVVEVEANGASSCARTRDGEVWCWGSLIVSSMCS